MVTYIGSGFQMMEHFIVVMHGKLIHMVHIEKCMPKDWRVHNPINVENGVSNVPLAENIRSSFCYTVLE